MLKTARTGFTLIELMIVIAIIAIIAAIAIPNLKDARKAANEAAAIAALRAIHSAQNVYREQDKDGNGTLDFATSPVALRDAELLALDPHPDAPTLDLYTSGYMLRPGGDPPNPWASMFTWSATATTPVEDWQQAGDRWFYINHTGVIRYTVDVMGGITEASPAIGK